MSERIAAHMRRNLVAYLALFVALGGTGYAATQITGTQVKNGSLTGADIRNGSLTGADIRRGSLRATLFAPGQLTSGRATAGAQGPQGPRGPAGPSFGESANVANRNDIACFTENVVGEQTITVTTPSRILALANGALTDDGAATTTYGLWLRLRNAADTATLAVGAHAWDYDDGAAAADRVMPLSVASVLGAGSGLQNPGAPFVAQPGTYRLQLIAYANEGAPCGAALPDFGVNGGASMGHVLLGTAP